MKSSLPKALRRAVEESMQEWKKIPEHDKEKYRGMVPPRPKNFRAVAKRK